MILWHFHKCIIITSLPSEYSRFMCISRKCVTLWRIRCPINTDHIHFINIRGEKDFSYYHLSLNWNKGLLEKNTVVLTQSLQRQSNLLSLLTVVLFGFVWPFAYISAGGLYTEAEKAAVIWPLGAGTFFPLTTANSPKGGKTKFSWRCNAIYYQQLETKILGNLRKSQLALLFWRFDGLHHNIVFLTFSSGLQQTWLVVALYCTLWVLDASQTHILLALCLQAENTNAHQSFHSLGVCSVSTPKTQNTTRRRLKIQVSET